MLTPQETLAIDRLKLQPEIKMLFDRLGLEPIPSKAYKQSKLVSDRVDQLLCEFTEAQNKPVVQRTTFTEGQATSLGSIFCQDATIEVYLITLYGPRPWKFPLPTAPF
jgi:hypothetical protein